ncbi:MAG TPA: hypothetical protein VJ717_10650 [Gemmatimonadaceae bacterium]|nr:hypothetical protein [Gemmatimonadaceae bacterium]
MTRFHLTPTLQHLTLVALSMQIVACIDRPVAPREPQDTHQIRLATLSSGEEIFVRFVAGGCYGQRRIELRFRPATDGDLTYSGTVSDMFDAELRPIYPLERASLVRLQATVHDTLLSASAVRALDALIEAYDHLNESQSCTAWTTVDLALYRNGELIRTERREDHTCSLPLDTLPLTFGMLVPDLYRAWRDQRAPGGAPRN